MKFSTFLLVMALILGSVLAALAVSPETGRAAGVIALVVLGLVAVYEVRASARSGRSKAGSRR